MVNKYTTGVPIIKPIDSIDVDFAHQVLVKKQEQFDTGYANLQKMYQAVNGLGLVKDNEKAYLEGKMKEATERINKMGNIDYSDSKLVGALGIDIANIAKDPKIQNYVMNKQNYDQYFERLSKLKSDPKLYEKYYSPYNEMEDMETVKNYLEDKTGEAKFRLNTPTIKVDINEKIDKELEKRMKIKTQRSDGVYIYTREGLTEEQLRAKVRADIAGDENVRKQLAINAKWKYNDDKVFSENFLSPLVQSYDKQIQAVEGEIQSLSAAILSSSGNEKELLTARKNNFVNQKTQLEVTRNGLISDKTDLQEKKKTYEMLQIEDRAVVSFPQSETRTPDKFQLLAQAGNQKEKQMKLGYEINKQLYEDKAKIDIAKEQEMEALGLNKSKSGSSGKGGSVEEGLNPIGEAMPTTAITQDNREVVIKTQIENFKSQNAAEYIGLMSKMLSKNLQEGNPKVIEEALTKAFLDQKAGGGETVQGKFFEDYVKKTPSYQKLESKMKLGLIAQYNNLNSAYKDVLDGNQDVDFTSWKFSPDTQEALTKIQLRSYNMKVKEDMLNKARKAAEDKMIQEVYKGDRKKFEEAKKVEFENTVNSANVTSLSSQGIYNTGSRNKVVSGRDVYSKYIENELLQANILLEKPYLISEKAMKEENYANIKNIVNNAIVNGGIYKTLNRTDDPAGLYGKIEGKASDEETFKNAKDFNVVQVWTDTGIAQVDVITKEGDKEIKTRGYVKMKPEAVEEMYKFGLNKKYGDRDFDEIVESTGVSPVMLSITNPPLFYKVVQDPYTKGYNVKLSLNSKLNGTVHIDTKSSSPSSARAAILKVINDEMYNSRTLAAMEANETKRKALYDAIVAKYSEKN